MLQCVSYYYRQRGVYGVVRDYAAISYQFTPTFFTSFEPSKTSETRMHYTHCCGVVIYKPNSFFTNSKSSDSADFRKSLFTLSLILSIETVSDKLY